MDYIGITYDFIGLQGAIDAFSPYSMARQAPEAKAPAPPPPPDVDPAWELPTADETAYPRDEDGESWLELLRDGRGP